MSIFITCIDLILLNLYLNLTLDILADWYGLWGLVSQFDKLWLKEIDIYVILLTFLRFYNRIKASPIIKAKNQTSRKIESSVKLEKQIYEKKEV